MTTDTAAGRAPARRALAATDDRALRDFGPARRAVFAAVARWRRRP